MLEEEASRLSKVVAARVPCSRREAEQYITDGRVRVDGKVIDQPQHRVAPHQQVEIDAQARLEPAQPATFLLHKPAGLTAEAALDLLAASNHWSGDTSGVRRTRSHGTGLVPLLALPRPASGLAVFSQDGRILRKLTEDALLIEQELVAEVTGTATPDALGRLRAGLLLDGQRLPPAHVSWQSEKRLRIAAKGFAADWVPAMCEQVGLKLTALRRIRIGRIAMAGLPVGQWRYLAPGEKF